MVSLIVFTVPFDLIIAQSGLPTSILNAFLLEGTCRATGTVSPTRAMLGADIYRYTVHRGFKERIFPEKNTNSRPPYGSSSIARVKRGLIMSLLQKRSFVASTLLGKT